MCQHMQHCIMQMQNKFQTDIMPNIHFVPDLPPLDDPINKGGVKGIITTLRRKGWGVDEMLKQANITTVDDLEFDILKEIKGVVEESPLVVTLKDQRLQNDPLLRIFIKIHIWGGRTGRNIFVKESGLDWDAVKPHYEHLIEVCTTPNASNAKILQAAKNFNSHVKHIGVSFITKHISFCTHVSRGQNALPIYDNTIADGLGLNRHWDNVEYYWYCMERILLQPHGDNPWPSCMDSLERQVFQHFRNLKKQKKKASCSKKVY